VTCVGAHQVEIGDHHWEVNMAVLLDEIHPGEFFQGNRPVTVDTALPHGLFFNMKPRFWLNLQTEYDMCCLPRRFRVFAGVSCS
jgi:hypothetical protein